MTDSIRVLHLQDEVAELQRQIRRLQTDAVTGLPVRSVFDREIANQRTKGGKRRADLFGILMIDIDHFKRYNDEHGHLDGDLELRRIAECIQKHLRPEDLLARYGGEEFAVIVPRSSRALLVRLAERVRMGVWLSGETTISVGYAARRFADPDEWAVVARADAALYEAKNAGRNCVRGNI
jgi:diguanylate cyclase (GGDEF)-like protein